MKIIKRFALFAVIFLTGCGYIPVRTPFLIGGNNYSEPSIATDRLRILSWNIQKQGGGGNWKNDFLRIANEDKKPHLILLQEVRLDTSIIKILKDDLRMGWEFSPNLYEHRHDAYSGVLTASFIEPIMATPALSSGTEPFTRTAKPFLYTKYLLDQASFKLLVVNVHCINFKIDLVAFKAQIQDFVGVVMEHDGPVLMAGDFNTWSGERLEHLYNRAVEMGLAKINFGSKARSIESAFGNALDHIFISKSKLAVVKGSQDVIVDVESSDHYPLFIELWVTP